MWIAVLAGWVFAAVALYSYLIYTAREPQNEDCMECKLCDCKDCPKVAEAARALKRAA